jgi:hypothetical protein
LDNRNDPGIVIEIAAPNIGIVNSTALGATKFEHLYAVPAQKSS